MPDQEEIHHQQTLLNMYRRNLAHLERQAASFGSEGAAPLHVANSLEDTRENIRRIKGILHGWGVKIDDLPDEGSPDAAATGQPSSVQSYPQSPSVVPQVQTATASSFKYDVFISYSHTDEQWVEHTLLKTLEDAGLRACIDFRDFAVGRPALINMQDAVLESRHTVLVITPAWVKSQWSLFETLLTQTEDPASLQSRTIPLRLQQSDIPKHISMLTWVDFTRADREAIAWNRLFAALGISGK